MHTPVYTGALFYFVEELECGWPYHAYIYEDGLIAGHGLGDTSREAFEDAYNEMMKSPPEGICQQCGRFHP